MIDVAEGKVDKRQLKALLRASLKTDWRGSSNPMNTAGRSRKFPPIIGVLILKAILGAFLAAFTYTIIDPFLSAFTVFTVMSVFLAIIILLEFSNLILSPDEYAIIAAQPVGSKTFFMAKQIHLLAYVNLLGIIMYVPSAVVAMSVNRDPLLLFSFTLAGLMTATGIGMAFVLLYTLMLKVVNRETMQRLLGYTQLVLVALIYFSYFVVPHILENKLLLQVNGFHSNWLYLAPTSWFAAIAALPGGALTLSRTIAALTAVVMLYIVYRAGTTRLSLKYAQTLANTVAQQKQLQARRKHGVLNRLMLLISNHEDRAVWRLIRKQFKYDNRFKMSILTIVPLTGFYVYLGVAKGEAIINPFIVAAHTKTEGMNLLLYVAAAMLPFLITIGTAYSESYRSAWVFYTSPADRTAVILASARFALTYFCLPFTILLVGLFTWFFGNVLHALLHCVMIYVILMILTKLMVLVHPRVPFSQPSKAGQRTVSMYLMILVTFPVMLIPMVVVANVGYGGYVGYSIYLASALLVNFVLHRIMKSVIPRRAAKLEFTAPV